ncbi:hypothetical protein [Rhizobium sp. RU36D]|uniref:hypothetical protein n=1 Tax=Rhizobium sp. RU36D TaxID=1907415 RepID=UPI0009D84A64|nr:hypothetical protein [Rhizobium sp. RU36D]SMD06046.1 NADH-quinone oxidoreductase subunit E [Rhizobium sp. RU36D]
MAKANDNSEEKTAAADLGRVDEAAANTGPADANPLMSSFAAASAIGFHFASQMAGAMLGSFQGALEATTKLARTLEEERKASASKAPEPADEGAPQASGPTAAPVMPAAAKPVVADAPKWEKTVAKAAATPKAKAKNEKAASTEVSAAVDPKPAKATTRKKAGKADDLKRISGIGPKVEQVLNGMGVTRFADIAAWTVDDIAKFDTELGFSGRIERDDWVGQAKALVGGKA